MIPIKITMTRTGLGFTAKEWRAVLKPGWERVGVFWHRYILRKHFTAAGAQEYGYQPRTAKYVARKLRKKGHSRPLVWSGATETQALRWREIGSTSKGARVVLRGLPAHVWMSQHATGRASRPNMPLELMTVSERDAQACARILDGFIQGEANKPGRTRSITGGHRRAG